jgi:hypothetical protein
MQVQNILINLILENVDRPGALYQCCRHFFPSVNANNSHRVRFIEKNSATEDTAITISNTVIGNKRCKDKRVEHKSITSIYTETYEAYLSFDCSVKNIAKHEREYIHSCDDVVGYFLIRNASLPIR